MASFYFKKQNSILKASIFIIICVLFVFLIYFTPFEIFFLPSKITQDKYLELLNQHNPFFAIKTNVFAQEENEELNKAIIEYKLFNLFTIKKLRVDVYPNLNDYYAGGNCIGFDITSKGAIVAGGNFIITANGYINPIRNSGLEIGDIITEIDGYKVESIETITRYLNSLKFEKNIPLKVLRNNKTYEIEITPAKDIQSNSYKLGLWLKDNIIGVGTLTFIKPSTSQFGTLGHPINTENTTDGFEVESGNIYNCTVVGVKQAEQNKAGQLLGTFSLNQKSQGVITKNNIFGVYGNLDKGTNLTENKEPIDIGGKSSAKPGKAKILCTIDGTQIEEFDIEIIKTNYQSGTKDKNMIIRITDPKLLNKTGGIVQGMSGSPIIQGGKLIGAVTHVFLNDATKGFGLFIDNMINELWLKQLRLI